ncbi:hypothetical protein C6A85_08895, partial [Mycobacterium sp. ITM-2017-0098]
DFDGVARRVAVETDLPARGAADPGLYGAVRAHGHRFHPRRGGGQRCRRGQQHRRRQCAKPFRHIPPGACVAQPLRQLHAG